MMSIIYCLMYSCCLHPLVVCLKNRDQASEEVCAKVKVKR